MEEFDTIILLVDIAIILFVALGFGVLASKLKQPVILGYLFAGILIGPYALHLIESVNDVHALAAVGVSLLMFVVGLEFSPEHLKHILKPAVIGGTLEMVLMFIIGTCLGSLFGLGMTESIFLGAVLSISSTIIIVKILEEKGESTQLHGRLMIGLLIVEDIGAIIIIATLTQLTESGSSTLLDILIPLFMAVFFISVMLTLGKVGIPRLMESVSKLQSKELFLLTIFALVLGTAALSYYFGLSVALGAFIAGVMLAQSDYALEVTNQVRPLRDIFMIIFFVSIGMSIDLMLVTQNMVFTSMVVVTMVLGKFFILSLSMRSLGYHGRTSVRVGLGMIQIGEFSFIIADLGLRSGAIGQTLYSVTIAGALVTMVLTPYAMNNNGLVYNTFMKSGFLFRMGERFPVTQSELPGKDSKRKLKDHIVIFGFGHVGKYTIDNLIKNRQSFVVVDYDPVKISYVQALGLPYIYGDGCNVPVLKKARVQEARMVVVAVPDGRDLLMIVRNVRRLNKKCMIIARVEHDSWKHLLEPENVTRMVNPQVAGGVSLVNHMDELLGLGKGKRGC